VTSGVTKCDGIEKQHACSIPHPGMSSWPASGGPSHILAVQSVTPLPLVTCALLPAPETCDRPCIPLHLLSTRALLISTQNWVPRSNVCAPFLCRRLTTICARSGSRHHLCIRVCIRGGTGSHPCSQPPWQQWCPTSRSKHC
jgi:hypothetical protein